MVRMHYDAWPPSGRMYGLTRRPSRYCSLSIRNLDLAIPEPSNRLAFTLDDLQAVLQALPARKAADGDGIAYEAIKMLDEPCQLALLAAFNELLHTDSPQPASWRHCLVVLIPKTGGPAPPGGYRPIALSACLSKVFSRLLLRTLTMSMQTFADWSVGFRRGSSCTHLTWPLRMVAEKCREWQEPVAFLKLDLKKAFDSIKRESLLSALLAARVPPE
eukprot:2371717-Amphidinium_carterae.1